MQNECMLRALLSSGFLLIATVLAGSAQTAAPPGFTALFNGRDLTGWVVPDGDNGHWRVVDGVID